MINKYLPQSQIVEQYLLNTFVQHEALVMQLQHVYRRARQGLTNSVISSPLPQIPSETIILFLV